MKRIILVSTLALVLSVTFVPVSSAQMAKEGTVLCTVTYSGITHQPSVDLDGPDKEERYAVLWDLLGIIQSDTGEGPFNNMSMRCIGVSYSDKGEEKVVGYAVWIDLDGDNVFQEYIFKDQKVVSKLLGGTGKFSGIEGIVEQTESPEIDLIPSMENSFSAIGPFKINYKLP